MKNLKAGVYKHYKGGLVLVLGVARHSESEERLVAYIPLSVKHKPRITVRPYDMFFEKVKLNGKDKPRFKYIGEDVDIKIATLYDPLSGYKGADRIDD
jgi:hypothetical protein